MSLLKATAWEAKPWSMQSLKVQKCGCINGKIGLKGYLPKQKTASATNKNETFIYNNKEKQTKKTKNWKRFSGKTMTRWPYYTRAVRRGFINTKAI